MRIKNLLFAVLLVLAPLAHADDQASDDPTATAIEVTGNVVYEAEEGVFKPVVLGQLFGQGDHVLTKDDAGLHLVLADGSSITLGPNSEMTLEQMGSGDPGSQTFLQLIKGTANAIVQKLKTGSAFEMHTPNAVAAVKGTEFEISEDGNAGSVSVHEGVVAMSDPGRINVVSIPPFQCSSTGPGLVMHVTHMSPFAIQSYEHHWAHARTMHLQRDVIIHRFARTMGARRAALRARRPMLQRRIRQHAMHRNAMDHHPRGERNSHAARNEGRQHSEQRPKARSGENRQSEKNGKGKSAKQKPKKRQEK